jgi:hypothetical protein
VPDSPGRLAIDRLLLVLIIIMLSVTAVINTVGNQRLEDTVKKTDIIAQCLTPGSECSRLTAERDKREQEYLKGLMKTTNICVLYASRQTEGQPLEELTRIYDECVSAGAPPPPEPIVGDREGN